MTIFIACSRVTGLAIGAPALIASSCLIAAARYRRVSANKSIGSVAHHMIWTIFPNRQSLTNLEHPSAPGRPEPAARRERKAQAQNRGSA